jgi:hypothetical protein
MASNQAGKIIGIESGPILVDERGRRFVPIGNGEWRELVAPPLAVEPIAPPPEPRALFSGRRNRAPRRS